MVIVVVIGWSLGGSLCGRQAHKGSADRVLKRIRDAGAVVDDHNSADNIGGRPKEMCRISAHQNEYSHLI